MHLRCKFEPGVSAQSLGLTGFESFSITGIGLSISPQQAAIVTVIRQDGSRLEFTTTVRTDAPAEVAYFSTAAFLQMVYASFSPPDRPRLAALAEALTSASPLTMLILYLASYRRFRCDA